MIVSLLYCLCFFICNICSSEREEEEYERELRSVMVSNIVPKATLEQIKAFFEQAGKVKKVNLVTDRFTKKHKGCLIFFHFKFFFLRFSSFFLLYQKMISISSPMLTIFIVFLFVDSVILNTKKQKVFRKQFVFLDNLFSDIQLVLNFHKRRKTEQQRLLQGKRFVLLIMQSVNEK